MSKGGAEPGGSLANGNIQESDDTSAKHATSTAKYYAVCLIGYSLSFIIFGSQVSVLGPTIKPLAEKLQVDETGLSPLFTALGISCILSGTPSGWIVDRFPTHHVLIASLLVEAIGFALVPYMPSVWSLTTLYFIICFSYNFTNSAVFTSLGWMFPKRAGGALNLVLAMFGVGSFFIPLASQACSMLLGDALAVFYLIGAMSLVSTIPFLFVSSPTRPAPEVDAEMVVQLQSSKTLENLTTAAVVLLVFLSTGAETAIGNWLFTFCSKEMQLDDSDAALVNSMFWAAFTVGRVFGVLISPFTTPSTLLLSSTPFSVAGASIPILMAGRMTWPLIMATALLTGFGNSTGYANAVALLEQYVPVTGFINGIFGAVAGAACMIGPTLVALLIKYSPFGYQSMAWVGLSFYFMHFPAILTAMTAGRAAVARSIVVEAEEVADLEEPLLSADLPEAIRARISDNGLTSRTSQDLSDPIYIRHRQASTEMEMPRGSLPGHGSITFSRTRSGSLRAGVLGSHASPHTTSMLLGSHNPSPIAGRQLLGSLSTGNNLREEL